MSQWVAEIDSRFYISCQHDLNLIIAEHVLDFCLLLSQCSKGFVTYWNMPVEVSAGDKKNATTI